MEAYKGVWEALGNIWEALGSVQEAFESVWEAYRKCMGSIWKHMEHEYVSVFKRMRAFESI